MSFLPSYVQAWSVLDGVLFLVLGAGLLIAKRPFFFAAIGWVLIETPIWTYLNATIDIGADVPTIAIVIPAIMTAVALGVAACCAYYVGKAKA